MKLVTFVSADGTPRAGICEGKKVYDLAAAAASVGASLPPDMTALLTLDEELEVTRRVAAQLHNVPYISLDQAALLAPVPYPSKVLALAGNYQAHIQEGGGQAVDKSKITPRVFMKPGTSVIGTGTAIRIPRWSNAVDYELEIAVVIGKHAKEVSTEDAAAYIAGYTIFNDVSARSLTIAEGREPRPMDDFFDWLNGKWFDTFGAMGPYLVTSDEVGDPHALTMRLKVNGQTRQDANTGQMIFNVYELVSFCSHLVTLEPGDIISTGTPSGVGDTTGTYLQSGDVVEGEIEKLGALRNGVQAEG
ncbi:MAG: fumarylacetoacetate hydrolase family protein [Candidatus Latescibacteria bacterium]|nr:fumarylacetoacetate hydrolase family protein [Candidatus Latescibacterota bacterium]